MSSVDSYTDAEAADYLNAIKKHIAENESGNTSSENFVPEFILPFVNQIDISNQFHLTTTNIHLQTKLISLTTNIYEQ